MTQCAFCEHIIEHGDKIHPNSIPPSCRPHMPFWMLDDTLPDPIGGSEPSYESTLPVWKRIWFKRIAPHILAVLWTISAIITIISMLSMLVK